ncbi:ribosomal protein S18 acetylase RimI-like enzyme [Streptomyces sp. V3I8]|uniref:GNAT family N-acetyltransferase n=1 Tax=Streptomyces sp. V3I8 TaxID=3042279 RepID=UPI0027808777|nr:GNAT family N-acetyltransferase [Streptomyces sp. V3I8]MDQ1035319.1 ribosomal protein S18 acetylase RimI-like enzyme [Streptomyces sp. V3I8]
MTVRAATSADLPVLQDIERAAGEPFRIFGMPEIADDEPPPLDLLERFRKAGHAWVAEDSAGRLVAYLIGEPVDGAFHIEQVSVHPDAAHQGVGRTLIAYVAGRARRQGLTGLSLTTFAEVPWNAPYYERLGFRVLAEHELTPGLRGIRAAEAENGLDRWPRVCMYLSTQPPGPRA